MSPPSIAVVIPTCDRGAVVLATVERLLSLATPPDELIVVDQSAAVATDVETRLGRLERAGRLRRERRDRRSIPAAMNRGAALARSDVVLFLDDDIEIDCELVREHALAHAAGGAAIVAGQVIQPWQRPLPAAESGYPEGVPGDPDAFRFNASRAQTVARFMAGNVSIRADCLRALGGFDENFVGAAYRFEADFSERAAARGFVTRFHPAASVRHLKVAHGGTRSFGHHLRTFAPWHSAGRWYYLLRHPRTRGALARTLSEAMRALAAREHLRRPWWIPAAAAAEIAGVLLAACAWLRGPRLGTFGEPHG